jgi:hypothetical protein
MSEGDPDLFGRHWENVRHANFRQPDTIRSKAIRGDDEEGGTFERSNDAIPP